MKKAVKKLREQKKQVKLETAKEDTFKAGIKKMVKLYLAEKAKVKLYKDNAKTIIERRAELGETELTDTDILNDDKFGKAKAEKENLILKAGKEKTDELVGSKKKDDGYYSKKRKAIDNYAFGKVNKTHKENK